MFKALFISAALLFSLSAFGEDHVHTPDVCSVKNPVVCAHLGIHKPLVSSEPGQFIVDIMTPGGVPFTDLKVDLWMPTMGHGTAPVVLKDIGHNHYLVSEAYFVMAGNWVVRLNFVFNGETLDIEIPLEIGE